MSYKEFAAQAGPNYQIGNGVSYGVYVLQRCGGVGRRELIFSNRENAEKFEPVVQNFMDSIVLWGDTYYSEAYVIEHNPSYSQSGKIEKLTPLQKKYADQFYSDIVRRVRNLQDQFFARVEKVFQLPAEITGGDAAVNAMQAIELRGYLLSLPMEERISVCFKGADSRVLHAIDTAPACMNLLPPGAKERLQETRVERLRGKDLIDLEDERIAMERIVGAVCGVSHGAEFVPRPDLPPMPKSVYPRKADGSKINIEDEISQTVEEYLASAGIVAA